VGVEVIQRWDFDDCAVSARDGYYVLYVEHLEVLEAALAAERAKVRELVEAINLFNKWYEYEGSVGGLAQVMYELKPLIEKYSKEEPNGS